MIAVQIADVFLLKKEEERKDFGWKNLLIWLIGFVIYRFLMTVDIPVGNTLPDMAAVILICLIVHAFAGRKGAKA